MSIIDCTADLLLNVDLYQVIKQISTNKACIEHFRDEVNIRTWADRTTGFWGFRGIPRKISGPSGQVWPSCVGVFVKITT